MARAGVDVVRAAGAVGRVCLGSFGTRVLRAARALEPAIATSASREEVRWALYRSWVHWPLRPRRVRRISGAGMVGPHARRVAAVRRRGASRGPRRPGLDRGHGSRRAAAARWGVDALITDRPDIVVPFVKRGR